jgi:hypothetical protein
MPTLRKIDIKTDGWVTVKEACAITGLSPQRIHALIKNRTIKARRHYYEYLILKSSLPNKK